MDVVALSIMEMTMTTVLSTVCASSFIFPYLGIMSQTKVGNEYTLFTSKPKRYEEQVDIALKKGG
jgi:hypothetical protein